MGAAPLPVPPLLKELAAGEQRLGLIDPEISPLSMAALLDHASSGRSSGKWPESICSRSRIKSL
jgi:hypothetical protein